MLSLDDQLIVPLYNNSCLYLINCLAHRGHWEIGLNKHWSHYCRCIEFRMEKQPLASGYPPYCTEKASADGQDLVV